MLVVQMVNDLPAKQETQVQSLGQEDPVEKGISTYSSILAWRIPWTEEPGGLESIGWQRVRHNWATNRDDGGLKVMVAVKSGEKRITFCAYFEGKIGRVFWCGGLTAWKKGVMNLRRDFPSDSVVKTLAPNAGSSGSIPRQGTRFHMLQPNILQATSKRSHMPQLRPGTVQKNEQTQSYQPDKVE